MPPVNLNLAKQLARAGVPVSIALTQSTPPGRSESAAQEACCQGSDHEAIQDAARASARALDDSVDERGSSSRAEAVARPEGLRSE